MKFGENHSLLFYCANYTMKHWKIQEISTWEYLTYFVLKLTGSGSGTSHIKVIYPTPGKLQPILTQSMEKIYFSQQLSLEGLKYHYCLYSPSLKEFILLLFNTQLCQVHSSHVSHTHTHTNVSRELIVIKTFQMHCPLWCIPWLSFSSKVAKNFWIDLLHPRDNLYIKQVTFIPLAHLYSPIGLI